VSNRFYESGSGEWYECDVEFDNQGVPFFKNPRKIEPEDITLGPIFEVHGDSWERCEPKMGEGRLYYPHAIEVSCTDTPSESPVSDANLRGLPQPPSA
jgi:hypothetical protein